MLKLKKIAKTMEIAVSWRNEDSLFNRPLLQAFAIAIALHLFALCFVQIRSFNLFGTQSSIPPVVVDTDIAFIDQSDVLAQLDVREELPRAIREPEPAKLRVPVLSPPEHSFLAFDYLMTTSELDPLSFSEPPSHPSGTEVHVSGAIAERYIPTPIPSSPLPTGPSLRYVYHIQVDNRTGELIWFERVSGNGDKLLTSKADMILRTLKFTPDSETFAANGAVEILFWRDGG